MNLFFWILYISLGFIAFAPLLHWSLFSVNTKYKDFKYVSILLVFWWLVDLLRLVLDNYIIIYYLSMLIFPLVLSLTFGIISSVVHYLDKPFKPIIKKGIVLLVITDFLISMTNPIHQLFLKVELDPTVTFESFQTAVFGPVLFIHTGITYLAIVFGIILIVANFYHRLKSTNDMIPFLLIIISLVSALLLNVIHLFVYTFSFDPTFYSIVLFISVLYYIFYIRDIALFIAFGRNRFLLDNLNNKYIIVNEQGEIIEVSKQFENELNITTDSFHSFTELKELLATQVFFYYEAEEIEDHENTYQMYLQVKKKEISLPLLHKTGTLYSFINNTADIKYIFDVNYVKRHDLMTRIYNRNYLEDVRDNLDESGGHYHIIMFDVDGLKLFNDILGHKAGDDLLIRFANQLKQLTTEEGLFPIRLGGDEFIILARNKPIEKIHQILSELKNINDLLPNIEKIHYSYAISSNLNNQFNMNLVLSDADINMYKMKKDKTDYKEKLKEMLTIEKEKSQYITK